MRRLLFSVLCIINFNTINAQNLNWEAWDNMFKGISANSEFKTGVILNKGILHKNLLEEYLKRDSVYQTFNNMIDVYRIWESSIVFDYFKFLETDSLLKSIQYQEEIGSIPICVFNLNGELLIEDFDTVNLSLDDSNQLYSNKGYVQTELLNYATGATSLQHFFNRELDFVFSSRYYYSNSFVKIKSLNYKVDGKENGILYPEQHLHLILNIGEHDLYFNVTLDDGSLISFKNRIRVSDPVKSQDESTEYTKIGDENGDIYTEPMYKTEKGGALGARVNIVPGITNGFENKCLKKPLIFVEGIDFGYKNHPTGCYGGKCGNIGLIDLLAGKVFNPYESQQSKIFEEWEPIKKAPELINKITEAGYDFIYLDFHNGADYMENNSMLLIHLINQINELKCSDEELVIVGASMGGQIVKYALSKMEKSNMKHCIRLFVDFDSPNEGANIPPGVQHFINFYSNKLPTVLDKKNRQLDRPATKELLLYHYASGSEEHELRNRFLNDLKNLGEYPKKTRNIAIVNGSVNGVCQSYKEGEKLLELNPLNPYIFLPFYQFNSTVYSATKSINGQNSVGFGKIPFKQELWVMPQNHQNIDHVPGSIRFDLKESRSIYLISNLVNYHDASCFIPSASALGLKSELWNNDQSKYDFNSKNPDHPFEAFYAEKGSNTEHMMLNDGNINWFMNQLYVNENELSSVLHSTYNFGRKERRTLSNLVIEKNGNLKINCSGLIGFGSGKFDVQQIENSKFELQTIDCGARVEIKNGGTLTIGEIGNGYANSGVLRINANSTLILRSNSTLIINDFSQLIIEHGAQLIYEAGANIYQIGHNSSIEIKGMVELLENAVFEIKTLNSQHGLLEINSISKSVFVSKGPAEIKLEGSSITNPLKLILNGVLDFNSSGINKINFKNCNLYFNTNAELICRNEFYAENSNFIQNQVSSASFPALKIEHTRTTVIEKCRFKDFNQAVSVTSIINGNFQLSNSEFNNCTKGVLADVESTVFKNTRFHQCDTGIQYIGNSFNDYVQSCQFRSCQNGILAKDCYSVINMIIDECDFYKCQNPVKVYKSTIALSCNVFSYNKKSLELNYCNLNMSQDVYSNVNEYIVKGGNNTFLNNEKTDLEVTASLIFLANGKNNFISNVSSHLFLSGDLILTSFISLSPNGIAFLDASNNYWSQFSNTTILNGYLINYDLKVNSSIQNNMPCYLTGTVLNQANSKCFSASSTCNPCDIVENESTAKADPMIPLKIFEFYPDPVQNELFINSLHPIDVLILNQSGEKVYSRNGLLGKEKLDVSELLPGLYFLVIEDKVKVSHYKFLKL